MNHLIFSLAFYPKTAKLLALVGCSFLLISCATPPPLISPPLIVEERVVEQRASPSLDQVAKAEVGESMYEEYSVSTSQRYTVTLLENAYGEMDFGLVAKVNVGTRLPLSKTSNLMYNAVCPNYSLQGIMPGAYGFCLVDSNQDGTFSSAMFPNRLKYFPLLNPVKYKIEADEVSSVVFTPTFKQTMLYQGLSKGSIKISFREFVKDMARPAFTQDISYDLEVDGTAIVAFKGMRVKVLKASGSSITYQVLKPFNKLTQN